MNSQRPGWYPDSTVPHLMRWWDGTAWTDDTYQRVEPMPDWSTTPHPAKAADVAGASRAAGTTEDGVPVAGWWRRAVAKVLDVAVTGALTLLVGLGQAAVLVSAISDQFREALRAAEAGQSAPAFVYDTRSLAAIATLSLLWLGVTLVYDLGFLLWKAATPGKLLLGLQVRAWLPGRQLGPAMVLRRWVGFEAASALSYVGTLYVVLDVLWPLRDARKQALHDKFAGTCVVQASAQRAISADAPD